MSWALLLSLLWKVGPYIIGALGLAGIALKLRQSGANAERAKQAAADKRANDLADEIFDDVRAMSPEQVDAELRRRAKR